MLPRLIGAFAIAILFRDHPDLIIGARMGAPLTVGYGEGENYLGSDALAVAPWTQRIAYLDEGDWAVVKRESIQIFDRDNRPVEREIVESGASSAPVEKGNYRHYMQKEIFEQPIVVAQTLQTYVRPFEGEVALPASESDLASVERVAIVACGTSFYVAMIGKYWIERFAGIRVEVDVASEFRYRDPVSAQHARHRHLAVGRTADTLAALRHMKEKGVRTPNHQRSDELDGARGRPAAPDPRRPGDRRRLYEGLHLPARGDGRAFGLYRAVQGPPEQRRGARHRRAPPGGAGRINAAWATTRTSPRWRT